MQGKDTPVWNVSLGGRATSATLYFMFGEYGSRHGAVRTEAYASAIADVPGLHARVTEARSKDSRAGAP